MRMLILSILVFALAGLALAFSKLGLVERVPQLFAASSHELKFEVAPAAVEDTSSVSLFRAQPEGVLLLTTANRAQTARFQMPQDVPLTSGALALRATAQIADDQHGLLRVLVGNQLRGEVLLRPGQYDINTEIELSADDLADDTLGVRYTLFVEDDNGSCGVDSDWSNVVEIEHDTRVILNVADTKLSPRDQVAAWGGVVLIGWPHWLSEEARHDRWLSAAQLAAKGYKVRFVDAPDSETFSGKGLAALVAAQTPAIRPETAAHAWPEFIAQTGPNAGHRTFKKSTTWRHRYRVGPDAHMSAPGEFEYEVLLGPLPGDADWTVVVTHNGTILEATEIGGRGGIHKARVDIGDAEILDSNLVEITATSNHETIGLCNNGPDLFAELRPTSRLLTGGQTFEDNLASVSGVLNQRQPVTVSFPVAMSLVEAQRMLDLTAGLITPDTELRLADGMPVLTGVRRKDIGATVGTWHSAALIVGLDQKKRAIVAAPAEIAEGQHEVANGAVVLVISPIVEDRLSMAPSQ